MSGFNPDFQPSPRRRARQQLIETLERLRVEVEPIRAAAAAINSDRLDELEDQPYEPQRENLLQVLTAIGRLLAAHLPQPRHRVVHGVELISRALGEAYFPLPDTPPADRDGAHRFLRESLGILGLALARAETRARLTYPGFPEIGGAAVMTTTNQAIGAAQGMVTTLSRFVRALDTIRQEENTAPEFEPQSDLVRIFALDMMLEIDIARAILRIDSVDHSVTLDLPGLTNIIAQTRGAGVNFQANVRAWFSRLSDRLKIASEDVDIHIQSLIAGLTALGGMLEPADEGQTGEAEIDWPVPTPDTSWADASGTDAIGLWASFDVPAKNGRKVTQRLRWIPPGTFRMGSPKSEEGRWRNEDLSEPITFAAGYWMFDTPCTQALWEAVMGGPSPSGFKGRNRPVENVPFHGIKGVKGVREFVQQLNSLKPNLNLSLPSEAQWEYACRAGDMDNATYAGPAIVDGKDNAAVLDKIAWWGTNSGGTHDVRGKEANKWGLYDMLGNVWEWCADEYAPTHADAPRDGAARGAGGASRAAKRVIRGGSWSFGARGVRAAFRLGVDPGDRDGDLGFRCARVQEQS